jgi:hypothetical protein
MSFQAQLVMLVWLPIILLLFNRFGPRTSIIISFIGGLLFLPRQAGFLLPLIPDYIGTIATCYGIMLAIIIYDPQRLSHFRWHWIDLPMSIWCICPIDFLLLFREQGTGNREQGTERRIET